VIGNNVWGFGPTFEDNQEQHVEQAQYPKWVQRAPDIGAVLCRNAAEEKELMDAWNAEQEANAKAAAEAAEKDAAAAKEQAELTLKNATNPGGDVNAGKGGKK
jgi:hypothetical protein